MKPLSHIPLLCTIMLIGGMVGAADVFQNSEIIFPEIAAIATGALLTPTLARRSRCFPRSLDTLQAVVEVFAEAYNRFGIAKFKYRQLHPRGEIPFGLVDFL